MSASKAWGKAVASVFFLRVEVPDLAVVRGALRGFPLFKEERKTLYGSTEIVYREPAGHVVTFAQFDQTEGTPPGTPRRRRAGGS
jgi:hypothetical protein